LVLRSNANGTPMVTEAVPSLNPSLINFTGYVQTVPLDASEAYVGRTKAAIFTFNTPLSESQKNRIVQFAMAQTGKAYDFTGFALMAFLSALYPVRFSNPVLYQAGLGALTLELDSTSVYVCSTLARTAYLQGIGVDITPAPDTSPVSGFFEELVPGFLADLQSRGLMVSPDSIAYGGVVVPVVNIGANNGINMMALGSVTPTSALSVQIQSVPGVGSKVSPASSVPSAIVVDLPDIPSLSFGPSASLASPVHTHVSTAFLPYRLVTLPKHFYLSSVHLSNRSKYVHEALSVKVKLPSFRKK